MEEQNDNVSKVTENESSLIPIEQLREIAKYGENGLSDKLDRNFDEYINSDDKEIEKSTKRANKKRFKRLKNHKESVEGDLIAVDIYQARYDRETWYYKRHKDTIDKYIKKDDKETSKKPKDNESVMVVNNNIDETLRIGFLKMLSIVWFDQIITLLGYIIWSPIYLIRGVVELFYKMKKPIAITVGILVAVAVLIIGLIFGVNALLHYGRSLS